MRVRALRVLLPVLVAAIAPAVLVQSAEAGVQYHLTPYSGFTPTGMNNHGAVSGYASPGGTPAAYYWTAADGATRIDFGSGYAEWANDINDDGMVCGTSQWIAGYSGIPDAWLYNANTSTVETIHDSQMSHAYTMTHGTEPALGGIYTYTNYSGTVYYKAAIYQPTGGTSYTTTHLTSGHRVLALSGGAAAGQINSSEAFYYDGTTFQTLPGLAAGMPEEVSDMNDARTIAGSARNADSRERAVIWHAGAAPSDLGVLANQSATPGTQESAAMGINHWGDVVGWSTLWIDTTRYTHAFVYVEGQMRDLNDLLDGSAPTISKAYAINNAGQIATERGLLTPHYTANRGFDTGDLGPWAQATGTGTVDVTTDPDDATNFVLRLITGSPVGASQQVDTPDRLFTLAFDYRFESAVGELSVLLDGIDLLPHITAADTDWHHAERLVTDPALWGLEDVALLLGLDAAAGPAIVLLDNVTITPSAAIPEPSALALLAAGAVALRRRRER